ncbi:MAG: indole-3-glycerol phosphate synthase [Chloroflexi bacterium]|nr:indole-3-glycerol phosphate synthase [Chloroflexota bacterium]|tara:strand:+ start:8302 stop:9087 length:786 start_codon:yes stop_codon:yes gene_type:complete
MGILEEIVKKKKQRLEIKKKALSLLELQSLSPNYDEIYNLENIFQKKNILISEMKRKSPSGGVLDKDLIPKNQAKIYIESGTDAISVLTEEDYFEGSNQDLINVLEISKPKEIPVLQKDFIFDEYQIYEARYLGADCILLIARILDENEYLRLYKIAKEIGLSVIVEVHNQKELNMALRTDLNIIGINNRDLDNLTTNLENFEKISKYIPAGIYKIAESGIKNSQDVKRMIDSGANGLLIGESIIKSNNIRKIISEISVNK